MSLTSAFPCDATTPGDTGSVEQTNNADSIREDVSDSRTTTSDGFSDTAGTSVTSGSIGDKDDCQMVDQSAVPCMDEMIMTHTASTISPPSTVISGKVSEFQSSGVLVQHSIAADHADYGHEDVALEQHHDTITQHPPEQVHIAQIDHVLARHLPSLSKSVIQAPARYVGSMPGKKIRDKAANALNVWLQVNDDDLNQIRQVISTLHNASLILDDVEDGSISRRGRPATHMVFGMPQAINSAGYHINKAMMDLLSLDNHVQCIQIFVEEMDRLYIGQGYDLYWTFNIKPPTVEDYINMVDYKTGALFNMLVRLMSARTQSTSPVVPDLHHLVVLLGRYFQIRDDYMNLTSLEYTDQKGFCEDLDEGKFSLTLIHAMENAAEADYNILQHLMAQRHVSSGMSLAQKHLVLDLLKATGSLEYTVATLRKISREIDVEVDSIESVTGIENRSLRTLLDLLKV
ncbi:hypothetical protein E8E14_014740 [Neopestalotiopsis sp. 37M]|nr:hypothetical protein E8E14_014740 [Neopestalotiopsis sp. 37M]